MENQTIEPQQITEQPKKDRKGLAIAGFIISLGSLFAWALSFFGLPIPIVGIILSALGIKSSKKGLGIAGVIISSIAVVLTIVVSIVVIAAAAAAAALDNIDYSSLLS